MSETLFKERYRELPAFQRIMDILKDLATSRSDITLEEIATRLLMASENGLNWDTLCNNCGVLMDDNYAKYCEIEQLKEQLEIVTQEARNSNAAVDAYEEMYYNPDGF